MTAGAAPQIGCRRPRSFGDGRARGSAEPASLLLPHRAVAVPGSHASVGDLVQNDVPHLVFVIELHEWTGQADHLLLITRHAGAPPRPIKHKTPLFQAVAVHEATGKLLNNLKIHASSLDCGPDTFSPQASSRGWGWHERFL